MNRNRILYWLEVAAWGLTIFLSGISLAVLLNLLHGDTPLVAGIAFGGAGLIWGALLSGHLQWRVGHRDDRRHRIR